MRYESLTLRVPPSTRDRLARASEALGVKPSDLARRALDVGLAVYVPEARVGSQEP